MSTKRRTPAEEKKTTPKKPAQKVKTSGIDGAPVRRAEMHPDEASYEFLLKELKAVPKERALSPNYGTEDCVDATLRLCERTAPHLHRLAHLDRGIPGTAQAFENLPRLARALRFINGRLLKAQASEGMGRIPEAMVVEGDERRTRMVQVVTYHLGQDPEVAATLKYIRGGVGHRDRAADLEELASIYEDKANVFAHDRTHYRPEDGPRARELAVEMLELLGKPRGGAIVEWTDLRASAHGLLAETYERVRRMLLAIETTASVDEYPPLTSAVRSVRPRGSRRAEEVTPSPEGEAPVAPGAPAAPAAPAAPNGAPGGNDDDTPV